MVRAYYPHAYTVRKGYYMQLSYISTHTYIGRYRYAGVPPILGLSFQMNVPSRLSTFACTYVGHYMFIGYTNQLYIQLTSQS